MSDGDLRDAVRKLSETLTGTISGTVRGQRVAVNDATSPQVVAGGWTHPLPPSFAFLDWEGGPRLEECAAAIGCSTETIYEGADHWIVVGRVLALYRMAYAAPLIFFGGRYANLGVTFETEILVSGF